MLFLRTVGYFLKSNYMHWRASFYLKLLSIRLSQKYRWREAKLLAAKKG
jgi:hypothetical protein